MTWVVHTVLAKVTNIVRWIAGFGKPIGKPFSASPNPQSPVRVLPESEIARHTLLRVMREWSEDAYGAGWMSGLEFTVWSMVQRWRGGDPRVNEMDSAMFHYLHEKSGGWWIWDDTAEHPVFVPAATWNAVYTQLEKELQKSDGMADAYKEPHDASP